ncbi:hypothetical protein EDB83DRAFT_2322154 [Lactarius deliciosus]|nr:hypothetical protein EDB83DRAFT_2322154 [Lactarius deliciosus]
MGRKTRGNRARMQTLAIARQKKAMLVNNSDGGGPSSNLAEDNHIVPENPSQSNEHVVADIHNEDVGTDHHSDLDLPPGITVPDGLSDSDNSSDDGDLEKEKANGKRKTPKTYRGNSKKTLDRREKDRKALASQGFLDIASFMALKKKEKELESWGDIEDDGLADCATSRSLDIEERWGGHHGEGTSSGPTDRAQCGHASIGIENTTVGHHSPVPSPQDQAQSERIDEADKRTFSEEEESSDEETPSFFGHTRRRITDDDVCVTEGLGKDTGPRVVGRERGKGRARHWAAEEEEESSDESSKLVSVAQYADNEDSRHGDNDPHPASSIEAENEGDSATHGDNDPDTVESEVMVPRKDGDSDTHLPLRVWPPRPCQDVPA